MIRPLIAAVVIATTAIPPVMAQTSLMQVLKPSPWSIGITLIQWAMKDREKVLYIEVTAEGTDLEEARRSAFRMAVERAVGTVISSESQAQSGRLVQDEIITYASGYVRDYQLVETNHLGDRVQVKMKIWVASNKLANRLLNRSQADGTIEGGKISQQIESLQYERASGDRLLLSVLKDYPYRAFDVRVLPTQVVMDQNRNPVLQIITEISWNRNYLDSIATAVRAINQRQDCDRFLRPSHCDRATVHIRTGDGQAWMDDEVAWNLFLREMVISKPKLQIDIINTGRTMIAFRQCWGVNELDQENYSSWRYVDVDAGRVRINSGAKQRFITHLPLNTLGVLPRDLDSVEVKIVRKQDCRYK